MKVKRFLVTFSVLFLLVILFFVSYSFAIWKTKKDIKTRLQDFLGEKVEFEDLKVSFTEFKFKSLKSDWFSIKKFSVDFNIFAVIFFKNLGTFEIDSLKLDLDSLFSFLKRKINLDKKDEKKDLVYFVVEDINIKNIILKYKETSHLFKNLKISFRIQDSEYQIIVKFHSPTFFDLKGKVIILGKGRDFKIFTKNLNSKIFSVNLIGNLKGEHFEATLNNFYIKGHILDKIDVKGKINKYGIKVDRMDIKSNLANLNVNFIFEDWEFRGFLVGNLNLDKIKSFVSSKFNIDLKSEMFYGDILLKNLIYKNFKFDTIFYSGKIYKNLEIEPDSFYIFSELLKIYGKGRLKEIDFKIEYLSQKFLEKFSFLNLDGGFNLKGTGILKIKKKDFDMITQGIIENLFIKDIKSDTINFTLNRKDGVNNINFYSKKIYFKNFAGSVDILRLNFLNFDSFNFVLKGNLPFFGNFEEEGDFINKVNRKILKIKSGIIYLHPVLDIKLDSLKFLNGYLKAKKENEILKINIYNLDLSYLPYLNLIGKVNSRIYLISQDFSFKLVEGNIKLSNFFYKFISLDSLNFSFRSEKDVITGDGFFTRNGKEGEIKFNRSNQETEFEISGVDFNITDFDIFFRELFKLEGGNYSFRFKGRLDKDRKFRYIARLNCDNLQGIFYPVVTNFERTKVYLVFMNDTFSYDFQGLSEDGQIKGSGIGKLGILEKGFNLSGKVKLKNVKIYPVQNIDANVDGEVIYVKDHRGLHIEGDLFVNKCFIYPYFEKEDLKSFSKTYLNLNLKGENIFISSEYLNAELKGSLIIFTPDFKRKVFKGRFDVKRGNIFYLGKIFDIKGISYVELKGEEKFDPELFVEAETYHFDPIGNRKIKIFVNVKGKLSAPQFFLSSEPPVYSESELLRLLTLGEEVVGSTIIEGAVSQEIRKRLKVEELMITGLLKGDPTFTVGTYITHNVYFKYSQALIDRSRNLYLLKYFLLPSLSIYTEKDEKGSLQSGVEFELRF
ncbi:MAG: translocation/assembly module TamB domain-containing protein [Candidatus Hydrothermales bacterium]